jgi:hypothetical protein
MPVFRRIGLSLSDSFKASSTSREPRSLPTHVQVLVEDEALADVALDLSVASRSTVLSWVAMTTTTTTMIIWM